MHATRWRRYGKDRLYVTDDHGAEVGWWDLATDEGHPASDELAAALASAVADWRAGVPLPPQPSDAPGPTTSPEPTAGTPPVPARQADAPRPASAATPDLPPGLDAVDGVAGGSAAREFQRRHDARHARVQANHPKIGRFLLAVFDDPPSTQAWSTGAKGEEVLGTLLADIAGPGLRVLHDRRIPRSTANIDHLVVCPSGVYVIDAKRYRDRRPSLRVEGGILRPRQELLMVGSRDRTALVDGMHKQLALVRAALAEHADIDVRGVLCFVDADWPLVGGSFDVQGVSVLWPKKLRELLTRPGPLGPDLIADLQWTLHESFPRQRNADTPPA